MAILITESEVADLLAMPDCIAAVEAAFRRQEEGLVTNHPRRRLRPTAGVLHCMEALDVGLGRMALKVYTSYRPGTRFLVLLYDSSNGDLLAMIEADRLGRMRTGAATGVAVKHMARTEASVLGLFGTGSQAETQALAVAGVRQLSKVIVYSRTEENRRSFAAKMEKMLGVEVIPADTPALAVREADIVVTATTSRTPVFDGNELRDGTHVTAVGSNSLAKAEIDVTTVSRASRVVIDSIEDARLESGDLLASIETGKLRWEQVRELREVVSGRFPGRETSEEITLFKSNGLALEDVAAASLVYDLAMQGGIGREVGL
jgi:ornithine cyclodeaminase/alanine dehydrogenase-like protein (mu-crystallin family)